MKVEAKYLVERIEVYCSEKEKDCQSHDSIAPSMNARLFFKFICCLDVETYYVQWTDKPIEKEQADASPSNEHFQINKIKI